MNSLGITNDRPASVRRALISVTKPAIDFAKALGWHGIELFTGGSAQQMRDEGLDVKDVAEVMARNDGWPGQTLHQSFVGFWRGATTIT